MLQVRTSIKQLVCENYFYLFLLSLAANIKFISNVDFKIFCTNFAR